MEQRDDGEATMTEWPDDWFRKAPDGGAQNPAFAAGPADPDLSAGTASGAGAGGAPGLAGSEPTTRLSYRQAGLPGPGGPAGPGPAASHWPVQPAVRTNGPGRPPGTGASPGGPGGYGGGGYPGRPGWRRWLRPRPILAAIAVLLCAAIIGSAASYFYLDSKLTRKPVLTDYAGRPPAGAGQNWLITGSDSRQGLSLAQERKLATGHDVSGQRSDTIMILHLPANGSRAVLVSLPRDSYVPIPGHGSGKINAAYSIGGPKLLAQTVQDVTGLRINHYMGIGFGGFVRVVNAVGGVRVCLKAPLVDPAAGLHLHKGCQVLNGAEALGFVRSRHDYATQDLQRIQNQRLFLSALLRKLTSTGVLVNPFESLPAASGVAGTLTVDKGTQLYQLLQVAFALRNPITTTVPIGNSNYVTPAGDSVLWNRTEALQLFHDLMTDKPIARSLITGSRLSG